MGALRQYMRDLTTDRGRIALVVMGVAWGTLSLSAALAFGTGFDRAMTAAVVNSGSDLIRIANGDTARPWRGRPPGSPIRLAKEDAALLARSIPQIKAVSVEYVGYGVTIARPDRTSNVNLHGVDPIYGAARRLPAQSGGRFLNQTDSSEQRRVAFLGNEAKERLFGAADPIGETIALFGAPFTVVGVLKPKVTLSNYEGMDESKVFIPATTFHALRGPRGPAYLIAWLRSPSEDGQALPEIYRVLGQKHGFDPRDKKAIRISNHVDTARRVGNIVGSARILMAGVAFFGFLASLVSVANVMFVMVEERRREMGIQMALGARPGWIRNGRLIEGALITLAGGVVGVVGSAVVVWILRLIPLDAQARGYLGYPELSIPTALAVACLLGLAGCVAGYWPARKAASIEPVKVLHE